jgi:hypothetical protein
MRTFISTYAEPTAGGTGAANFGGGFARLGWTLDLLPVGQAITVKGAPRRESACMLTSFIRADGVEISRNEDVRSCASARGRDGSDCGKCAWRAWQTVR